MVSELAFQYRLERQWFNARQALSNARTILAWHNLEGATVDDSNKSDEPGIVRLVIVADDTVYDDSYIDTWTDITDKQREHIRADLWHSIDQGGVWGVVGEYWDGNEWEQADACWSFIGNEWENSGYDVDIMQATIDAYQAHTDFSWPIITR